jgi:hypothetical protein
VLRAAIVPEGNRVHLPLKATVELRRLDVAIEHVKNCSTLVPVELYDAGGETAIDKQELLPCDGGVRITGCSERSAGQSVEEILA